MGIAEWWKGGGSVEGPGGHRVFVRADGAAEAPWMTFLHGFPTSSYDWAPVVARLDGGLRCLTFDFLGFGASAKPARHAHSIFEQADVAEAVWRAQGVSATVLVAHDYGLTVAQELLARRAEGRLDVAIERVVLLNGGAIPPLHRPVRVQRALASPVTGPLLSRLVSERTYTRGLAGVFAVKPTAAELHEHWLGMAREDGHRRSHALLGYLAERREHAARWVPALGRLDLPLRLIWGPLDPVSGAHMLAGLRELVPGAEVVELEGVGHYPQLEAPEAVVRSLT